MEEKGFLASLFDASFSSMITVKIVSFLYVTALIYLGVVGLAVLVYAFKEDVLMGLVGLILLPVAFVFFAILIRVYAELIIVIFKIADNTSVTAESVRQGAIVATFTSLNGDVLEIHRAATGQLIAKLAYEEWEIAKPLTEQEAAYVVANPEGVEAAFVQEVYERLRKSADEDSAEEDGTRE